VNRPWKPPGKLGSWRQAFEQHFAPSSVSAILCVLRSRSERDRAKGGCNLQPG
jgi:hypothetical protein